MESKRKHRRWIWLLPTVLIIVAVVVGGRQILLSRAQNTGPDPAQISTVFVGDLSASASASGTIEPQREANLTFDVPGLVKNVPVKIGDQVQAGDLLVELEATNLEMAVATAQQALIIQQANLALLQQVAHSEDIEAAQAAVDSARSQLDVLYEGPTPEEIAAAEANVRAMASSVDAAVAQLNQTLAGATSPEIAAARSDLASAEAAQKSALIAYDRAVQEKRNKEATSDALFVATQSVAAAQARLDDLLLGPTQDIVGSAQSSVSAASAQQDASQAQLDLLLMEPNASQVAALEAQVAQAESTLASLLEGASVESVAMAQAQVEQAQISLEEAEQALSQMRLIAPFDGVVTAIDTAVGELSAGPAITLMDNHGMDVILSVDEIDVGALLVGDPAVVTLETWPDTEIDTEIRAIAPAATLNPGDEIVTYDVYLNLGETDLPVRAGMTANARLITAYKKDVLLVPNRSVIADRQVGKYYVNLVKGEALEKIEVTIGLRDDVNTHITSGLVEGDRVLIGNAGSTSIFSDMFGQGE